jgi:ABC-type lipoprotein export system ATPase subunit
MHDCCTRAPADALVGSAGTPTLLNSALRLVRLATLQGGLRTAPLTVLGGVSGALLPGRLTLLLGPPGSGKTVFLHALAGRLQYGKHLRVSARPSA